MNRKYNVSLLIQQSISQVYSCTIFWVQPFQGGNEFGDLAAELVVLFVVVSFRNMVTSHNLQLSQVAFIFVLKKAAH
jgi:hypothetical protein